MKKILIFILLCSPGMGGTKQVLFSSTGSTTLSTSANKYLYLGGYFLSGSSGAPILPSGGTFRNLHVRLGGDPGAAGDYYDFTVYKNGSPCNITTRITGDTSNYRNSDISHDCTVSAGDAIDILADPTNGGTLSGVSVSLCIEFEGSGTNQNIFMGSVSSTVSNTAGRYIPIYGQASSTLEHRTMIIVPTSGTISSFRAKVVPEITSGAYVLTIAKNSTFTDVSCTISSSAPTCSSLESFTVAAGDLLSVYVDPTSSNPDAAKYLSVAAVFTTDSNNVFIIPSNTGSVTLSTTEDNYLSVGVPQLLSDTYSSVSSIMTDTLTITKAYGYMSAAQGSGKKYDTKLRKDNGDITPNFALTFSNKQGPVYSSDASYVPAAWSLYDTQATPDGTPTAGYLILSYLSSDSTSTTTTTSTTTSSTVGATTTTVRRNRMSLLGVG